MKTPLQLRLLLLLTAICGLYACLEDDQRADFMTGLRHYNKGEYTQAKTYFETTVQDRYKPAESSYYLGSIYFETDQFEASIAAYRKAITFKKRYASAYYGLARAYSRKNAPSQAIEALETAIELKREWRDQAKSDQAFSNLRNSTEFQRLVGTH